MKQSKLTPQHPLYDAYIKFHTGRLMGVERVRAKSLLFAIHYGNTDTSEADAEVERIRQENIRAT